MTLRPLSSSTDSHRPQVINFNGMTYYERLQGLLGAGSYQQLKLSHKGWIEGYLGDGSKIRQDEWTDSIAVGSKTFVEKVKALLGFRAMGRDVKESAGGYQLREGAASYNALFEPKKHDIGTKNNYFWDMGEVCRRLFLFHMDRAWSQYLADIADIREGIHWRRFGGQKPVREFIKVSVERFDELQKEIEECCLQTFEQLEGRQNRVDFEKAGFKTPSSTWTYMINDDPFEGTLNLQIVGNIGMALGAGLWWPLLLLVSWWKKIKTGKKRGLP